MTKIGVVRENNAIETISCDSCDGILLLKHYNNEVAVDDLMKIGDIISLGSICEITRDNKPDFCQICSCSNRARHSSKIKSFQNDAKFLEWCEARNGCEVYLWKNNKWWISNSDASKFEELTYDICPKQKLECELPRV